jgi:hypothetical protein
MKGFWNIAFLDDNGRLKQGHEFKILYNMYNCAEIGIIIRWRDGKLNDDGELPAVEFQDTHIEHYHNGMLHNIAANGEGKLKPAIISEYGSRCEYYVNGKQVG